MHASANAPVWQTPAIFLDRDGVIIEEKHYLCDPDGVVLISGVKEKLATLVNSGLPIVLVTNQSGIGRGMFGWGEYELVHERMLELLDLGELFAAVYANGHAPADKKADWRKPNPGMFLQAAADLNIALEPSVMVGDKLVDLQAASRAGIRRLVHVLTGHGADEREQVMSCFQHAELINSLADFQL